MPYKTKWKSEYVPIITFHSSVPNPIKTTATSKTCYSLYLSNIIILSKQNNTLISKKCWLIFKFPFVYFSVLVEFSFFSFENFF